MEKQKIAELDNKAAIAQIVRAQMPNITSTPTSSVAAAPQNISRPFEYHAETITNQPEPIFQTLRPRPQRLLHSEAYIKYVEGLTTESNSLSNWQSQLNGSKKFVKCPDETRLPVHWLANNGGHGTNLDALWALRDFLTCDSIGVTKIVHQLL